MTAELTTMAGVIAKVRDHTVGSEQTVATQSTAPATRYFNEIEIDLDESATSLAATARWPDRLFLQHGDHIVAAGYLELAQFRVLALCNLTDNSNYLFCGSPIQRRKLQQALRPLLPEGDAAHWIVAG